MAVCKRCGATFDYNKREGVCPKCCFYNRPNTTWQEDDSWIKNYSYEDNSYEFSTHEADYDDRISGDHLKDVLFDGERRFAMPGHNGNKELSGSHTHLDDGRVVKGRGTGRQRKPMAGKSANSPAKTKPKFGVGTIVVIIVWFYIIFSFLLSIMR